MPDVRQLLADAGGPNPRLALASVKALADELDWLLVRAVHLARAETGLASAGCGVATGGTAALRTPRWSATAAT
jgi:hypothetical protein